VETSVCICPDEPQPPLSAFPIFGKALFHFLDDLATRDQYPSTTTGTFQANIGANADDNPIRAAAWMRFAHADNFIDLKIGKHFSACLQQVKFW
jgi:hypothetical protein